MRLFAKSNQLVVEFCERCGRVCDAACYATAARERTLLQALTLGAGV